MIGVSKYRLVSPIYKQNLYHGRVESYAPGELPFNLFNKDLVKSYPVTKYARIMNADLTPGQCLYVPSFWFIQIDVDGVDGDE